MGFGMMMGVLFCLCIISHLLFSFAVSKSPTIDLIFQFGDSISDTGNDLHEIPRGAHYGCGRPPYGSTFFRHATGRCCDGRLIVDFFAEAMRLPYLFGYQYKKGNFTHGVNFAVTGATALNVSTLARKHITASVTHSSLLIQLEWFNSHLKTLCTSPSECKTKLANALFLVGEIGGNDYNAASFEGKSMDVLYGLVPDVVQTITHVVQKVIDVGAKRIIVPGNFPVGCMTVYLVTFKTNDSSKYDELNCLKYLNDFATFHNDQLQNAIKVLQKDNPDVVIVYGDYFTTLTWILGNATSLGFNKDVMMNACCGAGHDYDYNFNKHRICGSDGVVACPDPTKHISWDGIHLTEHAYHFMAYSLLNAILPAITPL